MMICSRGKALDVCSRQWKQSRDLRFESYVIEQRWLCMQMCSSSLLSPISSMTCCYRFVDQVRKKAQEASKPACIQNQPNTPQIVFIIPIISLEHASNHSIPLLMYRASSWSFGVPPLPNAPSVELAQAFKSPHLITDGKFFKAYHTFRLSLPILSYTILLGCVVIDHACGSSSLSDD